MWQIVRALQADWWNINTLLRPFRWSISYLLPKSEAHLITPVHKHVYFLFLQQVNMQVQNVRQNIGTQHEVPEINFSEGKLEIRKKRKGIATSHTRRVLTVFTLNGGERWKHSAALCVYLWKHLVLIVRKRLCTLCWAGTKWRPPRSFWHSQIMFQARRRNVRRKWLTRRCRAF